MQLHQLQAKTKRKTAKRVGRGGARGKTTGRGTKGQKSRAGGTPRPVERDLIKKIPKKRGYKFSYRATKPENVNLADLEKAAKIESGASVNPTVLVAAGLVRRQNGRVPAVKVLGNGELSKKLTFEKCSFSKSAKEKIEKAGGTINS